MDSVIAILHKVIAFDISPAVLGVLAVVVDFVLRLIKSDKALGIIHGISAVLQKAADAVGLVAQAVKKLADLSDKILPQRVNPPQA